MPRIELYILVNAPIEICFDLSRSIDLHRISTEKTKEEAIAGITTGLIGLQETVTWRARHLGVVQTLSTRITAFERPRFFVDEMVHGAFKSFRHEHHFQQAPTGTLVKDIFDYRSPLGVLGKLADRLFLKRYMQDLLMERNRVIKEYAESDKWKLILPQQNNEKTEKR